MKAIIMTEGKIVKTIEALSLKRTLKLAFGTLNWVPFSIKPEFPTEDVIRFDHESTTLLIKVEC